MTRSRTALLSLANSVALTFTSLKIPILGILSRQNILHHIALFHTGQPLIKSLEFVSQSPMIDAQTVQNRRIDLADMHRIFHHVIAEIIRLTIDHASLNSAARHPHRETSRMMIA